jgi:hypothetical protein
MQHCDPIWGRNGIAYCFGGGGSSTPTQTQPTTFQYNPADSSNTAQRQAAVLASTNGGAQDSTTFGSSLGTGGVDNSASSMGARNSITR